MKKPPTNAVGARATTVAILVASAIGIFVTVDGSQFIPDRFSSDDAKIQSIAQGLVTYDDKAFTAIGAIYRTLGLADHSTLAALLSYVLFLLGFWIILRPSDFRDVGPFELLAIVACILLGSIYLGEYTKEIVIVPVILLIGLGHKKSGLLHEVLIVGAMLAVGEYVRTYWFLVCLLYVGWRILIRLRVRPRVQIGFILVAFLVAAIAFSMVEGVTLDYYREHTNATRQTQGVNSVIKPVLGSGGKATSYFNVVITFALLLIPLPLIGLAGPVYLVAAVLVIGIAVQFVRAWRTYLYRDVPRNAPVERGMALVAALVMVQALFEPDYGSYLRHLTAALLLALMVILRVRSESRTMEEGVRRDMPLVRA